MAIRFTSDTGNLHPAFSNIALLRLLLAVSLTAAFFVAV
jgi:hypothetical protein